MPHSEASCGSALGIPRGHFCYLLLVKQIPRPVLSGRGRDTPHWEGEQSCSPLYPCIRVPRPHAVTSPQAERATLCVGSGAGLAPDRSLSVVPGV